MNKIWLNALRAAAGNAGAQSIGQVLLGLSGLTYYHPMDESSGTTVLDASGNNRTFTSSGVTLNQSGQSGPAYQFAGSGLLTASAALTAAINPAEFTAGYLIKSSAVGGSIVPRLLSIYTSSLAEWFSPELRTDGAVLGLFLKENGVEQNITLLDEPELDQWHSFFFYNSVSTNQCGVWLDTLNIAVGRAVPGLLSTTITANYPQIGYDLTGYLQHDFGLNRMLTQDEVNAIHYAAFGQPSTDIINLLTDEFTGSESAPIASPRASGLAVTDTGNRVSIASDQATWSTVGTSLVDPRLMLGSTFARKQGRAVLGVLTPGSLTLGWRKSNANGSPNSQAFWFRSGQLYNYLNAGTMNLVAVTTNGTVEYQTAHIMRRYGCYHLIKGGAFTEWTLIHVSDVDRVAMYVGFGTGDVTAATKVNTLKVSDLPAPFSKDFDLADTRLAGGRSATDTFTHEANSVITFALTKKPTGGNVDFRFREQDGSNYWQLTIDSSGVMVLNEVVAGSPTPQVTTAAGAIDTAHRVEITMDGTTIKVITVTAPGSDVAAVKINYGSASNFSSATSGRLSSLGTAGIVSDIVVYPRTLSGAAATVLDAAVA